MNTTIENLLAEIESKHGISILYACETGSRAWGFPSPDSDYDIRMIYKHDLDWYLTLSDRKDTIEHMSTDNLLDITGWDIKKCMKLLWKSNGSLLERLQSPIVYRNRTDFVAPLQDAAGACFSPKATVHHYMGLAKKSFAEIDGREQVKLKTLFYALRAAFACSWILAKNSAPPIVFVGMVNALHTDEHIVNRINDLIALKSTKPECYLLPAQKDLNKLIADTIATAETAFETLPVRNAGNDLLDTLFCQMVKMK